MFFADDEVKSLVAGASNDENIIYKLIDMLDNSLTQLETRKKGDLVNEISRYISVDTAAMGNMSLDEMRKVRRTTALLKPGFLSGTSLKRDPVTDARQKLENMFDDNMKRIKERNK